MARSIGLVVVAWLGVSWATSVRADDAAFARFYYAEASAHFEAGRYQEALRDFIQVQRLSPNARITFNIALCFQRLRRSPEAFQLFTEYLEQQDDVDGSDERRAFAARSIAELSPQLARVSVTCPTCPDGRGVIRVDRADHGTWGRTPRVLALPPGRHELSVDADGFRAATTAVEVARGALAEVELRPVRRVGQLRLRVRGGRATHVEVHDLGGVLLASSDLDATRESPLAAPLPPGRVELRVTARGFVAYETHVTIVEDRATEHAVVLAATPPPTGALVVVASAEGASVEVGGRSAGWSPVVLREITAGWTRVRVSAPRHRSWWGPVRVPDGGEGVLSVDLAPEPVGSAAPWVTGVAGLAALTTGSVLGIFALVLSNEVDEGASQFPPRDVRAEHDRAGSFALAADVTLGAGVALVGSAIVMYFVDRDRPTRASRARYSEATRR